MTIPLADASEREIMIESFSTPSHTWKAVNDPVMGDESSSAFEVQDAVAKFDGEVAVNFPFFHSPGFIAMSTVAGNFPDVSSCTALKLNLMTMDEYEGYRISFGTVHVPGGHPDSMGYKAHFDAPVHNFGDVIIPFDAFSSKWDDKTGAQLVSCKEAPKYCPDRSTLSDFRTISIWGEGIVGSVHLRVKSISAVGCSQPALRSNDDHSGALIMIECMQITIALSIMLSVITIMWRLKYSNEEVQYRKIGDVNNESYQTADTIITDECSDEFEDQFYSFHDQDVTIHW